MTLLSRPAGRLSSWLASVEDRARGLWPALTCGVVAQLPRLCGCRVRLGTLASPPFSACEVFLLAPSDFPEAEAEAEGARAPAPCAEQPLAGSSNASGAWTGAP